MRVEDITLRDLQKMRNRVKSTSQLAAFFEGDSTKVIASINNLTQPPVNYVKSLQYPALAGLVLKKGYPRAASLLGVSSTFLYNYLREKLSNISVLVQPWDSEMFRPLTREEVLEKVEQIPFKTLLEAVTGWTGSELKKAGIFVRSTSTPSNLTSTKGRKAELVYKALRGSKIMVDLNETDEKSPYDFMDGEFNRVDVKSAKQGAVKSGDKRWYFSLKGNDCDYFACIGFDPLFENPVFLIMVRNTNELGGSTSLVFRAEDLEQEGVIKIDPGIIASI